MARLRRSQFWPAVTSPEPEAEIEAVDDKSEKSKKKKSGFAKIWQKVTGTSKNDLMPVERRETPNHVRSEDDAPLAPPPPLSFLVDRGPAEITIAAPRHASTPSLGMSPGTAPSSPLPSPTPSGGDRETEGRVTSGVFNDKDQCDSPAEESSKTASFKNVHPVTSEPDMRQLGLWTPNNNGNNNNTRPSNLGVSQTLPLSRPVSMMMREKSLPPLPHELRGRPQTERPMTFYTYGQQSNGQGADHRSDFLPPHAAFRTSETRRQSFGGTTSRPNLGLQTLPVPSTSANDQRRSLAPNYDEFGFSRGSLGRLQHVLEDPQLNSTTTPSKRKSRFGLSSLFGKKSGDRQSAYDSHEQEFPTLRRSGSGGHDELLTNGGNATSTSRHSSGGPGTGPRMSVASRKALEELVAQDPEFVAYRYPSSDQRLDLLR